MIDEKKYEGHTPGPWVVCCEDSTLYARWIQADEKSVCSDLNDATEVDARLIAVAPDLLAEVKQLREGVQQLYESIGTMEIQGNIAIRKALKEMIE